MNARLELMIATPMPSVLTQRAVLTAHVTKVTQAMEHLAQVSGVFIEASLGKIPVGGALSLVDGIGMYLPPDLMLGYGSDMGQIL